MTAVGLSWSNSSSSMFVLATRAIQSWLLHFSHGIGGLLLGLSQKGLRPSAVGPFESDCAMLYSRTLSWSDALYRLWSKPKLCQWQTVNSQRKGRIEVRQFIANVLVALKATTTCHWISQSWYDWMVDETEGYKRTAIGYVLIPCTNGMWCGTQVPQGTTLSNANFSNVKCACWKCPLKMSNKLLIVRNMHFFFKSDLKWQLLNKLNKICFFSLFFENSIFICNYLWQIWCISNQTMLNNYCFFWKMWV